MWYRSAQLYDVDGKNLLEFGPFVMPEPLNPKVYTGVPKGFSSPWKQATSLWSTATWMPEYGLQFWTMDGRLIGTQRPNASVFDTLRAFEPLRFKSDVTDKIILDLYRRGKLIEQAVQVATAQNPSLTPQQRLQIAATYMKEYNVVPKYDEQGNLLNTPGYYPRQSAQEDAVTRQEMQAEYLAAPKQANEQGFDFAPDSQVETGQQYRARYTDAYQKAYAEYEANGRKLPFAQWKQQFNDAFSRGQYGTAATKSMPAMNQVQNQNQSTGTYQMSQDAAGNVSILQSDGRTYAYIPASQVQYQTNYIKKMTGQTPRSNIQTLK